MDTLAHCLLLERCDALRAGVAAALLDAFPDSASCLAAGVAGWREAGLSATAASALAALCRDRGAGWLRAEWRRLRALGVEAVAICDRDYPALLRTIDRPPPWLYLRGDRSALMLPQVAVVGSRKASALGLRAARRLAGDCVAAGLGVTSGLALGIDGAAHRGALDAGGTTVAVMATGIDRVYPRRHRELAERVVRGGCLVSELAPGAEPLRAHFPRRNRLISGMALGTVVVEAALPSGSLLTACAAAEQGRDVFAVPWSVFHAGGQGCLQLLADGAGVARGAEDVVAGLGWSGLAAPAPAPAPAAPALSPGAQRAYEALEGGVLSADAIAALLAEPVQAVLAAVGELELAGVARRRAGGYERLR